MRTYMDAYGLRPLERVRVWRLKMDFRNAISQRGNEARARPGGHTYLRRSVYICWILTKIIQFAPYRQSRPCCRQLDRTILCAHNSRVTITQLRVTKNGKNAPRLSRILHPQFHETDMFEVSFYPKRNISSVILLFRPSTTWNFERKLF